MQWHLILEEFGPELVYVHGQDNVVADALSHLNLDYSLTPQIPSQLAEAFGQEELSTDIFPINYSLLDKYQRKDKALLSKLENPSYTLHPFHGGDKHPVKLICRNEKIVVPAGLQKQVVCWYHDVLCHPGMNCTEETIRQHFTFNKLKEKVQQHCEQCVTCQMTKRDIKKYGHLPEKKAEADPWEILCVDLIGPYIFKCKDKPALKLWCLTMIDPATGWFEMIELETKDSIYVAEKVQQVWLT